MKRSVVFGKLGKKLVAVLLCITIFPLLLSFTLGYYSLKRHFLEKTRLNIHALTRLQVAQINGFLKDKQSQIRSIAVADRYIQRLLQQLPSSSQRRSLKDRLVQHLRKKIRASEVSALGILDQKGRVVVSSGHSLKMNPPKEPPKVSKNPELMGIYHFHKSTQTILRLSFPIQADQKILGFLVVDFFFSIHQRFLQEKKAPAFQGDIYLLNFENHVLCGSFDVGSGHMPFGKHKTSLPKDAHKHFGKVIWYSAKNGESYLGQLAPIANGNWRILVELPVEKALLPLHSMAWKASAFLLVFVLLLIFAVWGTTRYIVRPLGQVLQATHVIREGQFETQLPEPRADELGELVSAFQEMASALQRSYEGLEDKVQERTRELEDAKRFSELLFQSIPEVILVTDKNLKIVTANQKARQMFGESVLGEYCHDIFQEEGQESRACLAEKALRTGVPQRHENKHPNRRTGEYFLIDFFPIHDEKGDTIGVLESAKVMTQQRRLTMQAIHREKMAAIGLLASSVAHEIGNPLASIYAVMQRLVRETEDPDDKEIFEELEERCQYITRILGTLRDYSRKAPDKMVPIDINRDIQTALEIMHFNKKFQKVQVHTDLFPDCPMIWGVQDALSQIVTNLLHNALDAVSDKEDGAITIQTWASSKGVNVQITDNGKGMAKEVQERIFEPFYSTKPKGEGTGLGLFICRTLVESLHGTITVTSNPDGGSVFALWFPGALGDEQGDEHESA